MRCASSPGCRRARGWVALALALCAAAPLAQAFCFDLAQKTYGIAAPLLMAIAEQESGFNPRAVGGNTNGSRDMGLMQINSSWLPLLARHGVSERDLFDPCTNVMIGAWVLANNVRRHGPTVKALGAYNAASPERQLRYATAVLRRLPKFQSLSVQLAAPAS